MNRAYLFNSGSQFEPVSQSPWNPMMQMPEDTTDTISRPIWSIVSSPVSSSSPNKLNMPLMEHFVEDNLMGIRNSMPVDPNLPSFGSDPGFAERAAKFSCFGNQLVSNLKKTEVLVGVNDSPVAGIEKIDRFSVRFEEINNSDETKMKLGRLLDSAANSNEESSVSEQISNGELGFKNKKDLNSRKRRSSSKKDEDEINDLKRLKKKDDINKVKIDEKSKLPEPPKDYIHVRARRGQATDSHSLAERVRREKISERMNLLQNLVPNCNKVTGKALMLDEIINYVQSLQRQVEFLSMKLATVNPSLDIDTNDLIPQNDCQSNGNVSHQTSKAYQHNPQVVFDGSAPMNLPVHDFNEPFSHILGFGQDDLQSIVRMGFRENLDLDTSFLHTTHSQPTNMKMEL